MSSDAGGTLLEVVVALTILVVAGTASVSLVAQATRAVESARAEDRDLRAASEFLGAVSLWPKKDLDRRLGSHRQGPWSLRIHRPEPAVYAVTLSDTLTSELLLETAFFRPERQRE